MTCAECPVALLCLGGHISDWKKHVCESCEAVALTDGHLCHWVRRCPEAAALSARVDKSWCCPWCRSPTEQKRVDRYRGRRYWRIDTDVDDEPQDYAEEIVFGL